MKRDEKLKLAVINEINRIYNSLLERETSTGEVNMWLSEIFTKGHTVEDVEKAIRASIEFKNIKSAEIFLGFLKDLFFLTFNREIQFDELEFWKKKIISEGLTRDEIKNELEKTEEFQLIKEEKIKDIEFEIWKLYKNLFNRDPLEKELDLWRTEIIEKNRKLIDIFKELKRSSEYKLYTYNEEIKTQIISKQMNDFLRVMNYLQGKEHSESILPLIDLMKISYINQLPMSERFDEYLLVLKNLKNEGKLLDVGCSESLFCQELSKKTNLDVYGIDIRDFEFTPNFHFSKESAEKTHFKDDFFDQITIISSLEHFGMSAYGNAKLDKDADFKAMKEMKRILKPNGIILITLPFGKGQTKNYRKYDNDRIEKIMKDFEILDVQFSKQMKIGWQHVKEKELDMERFSEYYPNLELPNSIVLIKAKLA